MKHFTMLIIGLFITNLSFVHTFANNGIIGDLIWLDENSNGTPDASEPGISGVSIYLIDIGIDGFYGTSDDVLLDTILSDTVGEYQFEQVAFGYYVVEVQAGIGTPLEGLIPTTNPSAPVEISASDSLIDHMDFGFYCIDPMVSFVTFDVSCFGLSNGSIDVTASSPSGGSLLFQWSYGSGTADLSSIPAGNYSLTVTDLVGCSVVDSATLTEPSPLLIEVDKQHVGCPGGSNGEIDITVSGGTAPYTFTWGHGYPGEDPTNLSEGIYELTVEDGNGCTGNIIAQILEPQEFTPNDRFIQLDYVDQQGNCYPNTKALGINDNLEIVGTYETVNGRRGFKYANGVYSSFNISSHQTIPKDINNNGWVVGNYIHSNSGNNSTFFYTGSAFYGLGNIVELNGINDANKVVGTRNGCSNPFGPGAAQWRGFHGDLLPYGGGYGLFNGIDLCRLDCNEACINQWSLSTQAKGINNSDDVSGYSWSVTNPNQPIGWYYNDAKNDYDNVTMHEPHDISNKLGDRGPWIVGDGYPNGDNTTASRGVLYDQATKNFETFDYPGTQDTKVRGINNDKVIVGYYVDKNGLTHGYYTFITPTGVYTPRAQAIENLKPPTGSSYAHEPIMIKEDINLIRHVDDNFRVVDGLVADGVTPLLFVWKTTPEQEHFVEVKVDGVGDHVADYLANKIRMWDKGKFGPPGGFLTSTTDGQNAYAMMEAIDAEFLGQELRKRNKKSLNVTVALKDYNHNMVKDELNFELVLPPIALVHGINGDINYWEFELDFGSDGSFNILKKPIPDALRKYRYDEFVQPVEYGVLENINTGERERTGNIKGTLEENANELSTTLELLTYAYRFGTYKDDGKRWAISRINAIGHSQGGVLLQYISQDNTGNKGFAREANFYRGRFHRAISIGSPHNGARIGYYSEELLRLGQTKELPRLTQFMLNEVLKSVHLPKWNPWGSQIVHSNNLSIHPELRFHVIATRSDQKGTPPIYDLAMIGNSFVRSIVLGRHNGVVGSDGIVDFGSQHAGVSDMHSKNDFAIDISHAGGESIFADKLSALIEMLAARYNIEHLVPAESIAAAACNYMDETSVDVCSPPLINAVFGSEEHQPLSPTIADWLEFVIDGNSNYYGPFIKPTTHTLNDKILIELLAEYLVDNVGDFEILVNLFTRPSNKTFSDANSNEPDTVFVQNLIDPALSFGIDDITWYAYEMKRDQWTTKGIEIIKDSIDATVVYDSTVNAPVMIFCHVEIDSVHQYISDPVIINRDLTGVLEGIALITDTSFSTGERILPSSYGLYVDSTLSPADTNIHSLAFNDSVIYSVDDTSIVRQVSEMHFIAVNEGSTWLRVHYANKTDSQMINVFKPIAVSIVSPVSESYVNSTFGLNLSVNVDSSEISQLTLLNGSTIIKTFAVDSLDLVDSNLVLDVGPLSTGYHTLSVLVKDAIGNEALSNYIDIEVVDSAIGKFAMNPDFVRFSEEADTIEVKVVNMGTTNLTIDYVTQGFSWIQIEEDSEGSFLVSTTDNLGQSGRSGFIAFIDSADFGITDTVRIDQHGAALPPLGIQATKGDPEFVTISWIPDSLGDYFRVYRCISEHGPVAGISGWVTGNSYQDTTANADTTYCYKVQSAADPLGQITSLFSETDIGWVASCVQAGFGVINQCDSFLLMNTSINTHYNTQYSWDVLSDGIVEDSSTNIKLYNVYGGDFPVTLIAQNDIGCVDTFVQVVSLCEINAPYCQAPFGLESSAGSTTAAVTWSDTFDTGFGYELQWSEEDSLVINDSVHWSFTTLRSVNDTFYFANLIPNTTYLWRVRKVCDSLFTKFSTWSDYFASTTSCPAPDSTWTSAITDSSATLHWKPVEGAQGYLIRCQQSGVASTLRKVVDPSATSFSSIAEGIDLQAGTDYIWLIQAVCDEVDTLLSPNSPINSFTTLQPSNQNKSLEGLQASDEPFKVMVVPNPNRGRFEVLMRFEDAGSQAFATITIHNLLGASILQQRVEVSGADQTLVEQLSIDEHGTYLLEVEFGGKIVGRKVVVF